MKNSSQLLSKPVIVCLLACFCCALWGSAFPFVKLGFSSLGIGSGHTDSQLLFAGLRFTLAGTAVVFFGSLCRRRPLLPTKQAFPKICVISLFQTVLQYSFFFIGLAHTSGSNASIIDSTSTFVAILVSALIFRQEKLTARKMIGCAVGFAGIVLVNLSGDFSFSLIGDGFILVSAASYGCSGVFMKYYSKNEDPIMLSGYQFLLGGLIMTAAGLLLGGNFAQFNAEGTLILIYLAVVSAAAYTVWGLLLKYNPVSKVTVYGFMIPVFGVLMSACILGEAQNLGVGTFGALTLVSIGVLTVNTADRPRKQ